jgi:cell fate (sporulation/competence/biofilm development) regulator YlbF (YheA/YmcA/DUF963 family)
MTDSIPDDQEIATPSVVRQAARDFASDLATTPQFRAFEQARQRLRADQAAQQATMVYLSKQQSVRVASMLNAIGSEEQADLLQLERTYQAQPAVAAYLQALAEVTALCQVAADRLSRRLSLDFAAACHGTCC